MARIAGVDLPREKRVDVALRYSYGIGPTKARQTVEALSIDGGRKVRDLTDEEVTRIRAWLDRNYKVEGDLRREVWISTAAGCASGRVCVYRRGPKWIR